MSARPKDWRRLATRYDRCAGLFLSSALVAAESSNLSQDSREEVQGTPRHPQVYRSQT